MITFGLGCPECKGTCEEGLEGILGDLGDAFQDSQWQQLADNMGITVAQAHARFPNLGPFTPPAGYNVPIPSNVYIPQGVSINQLTQTLYNAQATGDTETAQLVSQQLNNVYANSTPVALQPVVSSVLNAITTPATPADSTGQPIVQTASTVTSLMSQSIGGVPYWLIGVGVLGFLFLKGKE